MKRFKFGGSGDSGQERESPPGPSVGQEQGMDGDEERNASEQPSSGLFAWPESTPSTTAGQPSSSPPQDVPSAHAEVVSSAYADQADRQTQDGGAQGESLRRSPARRSRGVNSSRR